MTALRLAQATTALFFCLAEIAFSQPGLSRHDLDAAASDYLMTITAPPDATPEAILQTILHNPTLPKHIRDPFVTLARAKAPHLVQKDLSHGEQHAGVITE